MRVLRPAELKVPHQLQKNVRNRILALLPADEFKSIMDKMHYVEHSLGESLHRAGEPIESVFFVESGFISADNALGRRPA